MLNKKEQLLDGIQIKHLYVHSFPEHFLKLKKNIYLVKGDKEKKTNWAD